MASADDLVAQLTNIAEQLTASNAIIGGTGVITSSAATLSTGALTPVGYATGASNAVTVTTAGKAYAQYIGRAGNSLSSMRVHTKVITAVATSILWAELAIFKGSINPNGNASLTRCGYTDVSATFNSTGIIGTNITLSGVSATDDLWLVWGSSATTPFQILGCAQPDTLQSGVFCINASLQPSAASGATTFTLAGAAVVAGWAVCFPTV